MTTDRSEFELETRFAHLADIPEMARLFAALGYPIDPGALAARFAAFDGLGEQALVAARSSAGDAPEHLLGLATLHATPVLHRAGPVGRVTALVVDPDSRGQGIGRQLMAAAEAWATTRGCVLIEVTSNRRRTDAHAFYERLGYEATSFRFGKVLACRSE
jgi:GNAT superfamily N-acetyltransferase